MFLLLFQFRLKNCGVLHPIYLIEEHGEMAHLTVEPAVLNQAVANTQVQYIQIGLLEITIPLFLLTPTPFHFTDPSIFIDSSMFSDFHLTPTPSQALSSPSFYLTYTHFSTPPPIHFIDSSTTPPPFD